MSKYQEWLKTRKYCQGCDQTKDTSDFSTDNSRYDSLCCYCRICWSKRGMEYKRRNPEKVREYNRRYLYKGYTKEHEDVTNCQICKVDLTKFKRGDTVQCIDHDHKTGRIRGVLCGRCNKGLGHFKDSLEILREAIKYLEQ